MSAPSTFGGRGLLIVLAVLGVLALFDIILYFAFIGVLVYYIYRLEKRIGDLESKLIQSGPGK